MHISNEERKIQKVFKAGIQLSNMSYFVIGLSFIIQEQLTVTILLQSNSCFYICIFVS